MTVYEIMTMFVKEDAQYFELWSNSEMDKIFEGYLLDLPEELKEEMVTSIDNIGRYNDGRITLNVF